MQVSVVVLPLSEDFLSSRNNVPSVNCLPWNVEAMAAALRLYYEVADYLKRYPVGYDKNKKRTLRRKATNHFKVKEGSLYYSLDGKTEC